MWCNNLAQLLVLPTLKSMLFSSRKLNWKNVQFFKNFICPCSAFVKKAQKQKNAIVLELRTQSKLKHLFPVFGVQKAYFFFIQQQVCHTWHWLCEVHLWSEHLTVTTGGPFCGSDTFGCHTPPPPAGWLDVTDPTPHWRSPKAMWAIYSTHIWHAILSNVERRDKGG